MCVCVCTYLRSIIAIIFYITFAPRCITPSFLTPDHLKVDSSLLGEAHLESCYKPTRFSTIHWQESLLPVKPIYSVFFPDMYLIQFPSFFSRRSITCSTETFSLYVSLFFSSFHLSLLLSLISSTFLLSTHQPTLIWPCVRYQRYTAETCSLVSRSFNREPDYTNEQWPVHI